MFSACGIVDKYADVAHWTCENSMDIDNNVSLLLKHVWSIWHSWEICRHCLLCNAKWRKHHYHDALTFFISESTRRKGWCVTSVRLIHEVHSWTIYFKYPMLVLEQLENDEIASMCCFNIYFCIIKFALKNNFR